MPTSTIARDADVVAPTLAGPEIGVASTKAFTCQLMVLANLAIAAGNTIVWKPSEFSSVSALEFGKLFEKAGFPPAT